MGPSESMRRQEVIANEHSNRDRRWLTFRMMAHRSVLVWFGEGMRAEDGG